MERREFWQTFYVNELIFESFYSPTIWISPANHDGSAVPLTPNLTVRARLSESDGWVTVTSNSSFLILQWSQLIFEALCNPIQVDSIMYLEVSCRLFNTQSRPTLKKIIIKSVWLSFRNESWRAPLESDTQAWSWVLSRFITREVILHTPQISPRCAGPLRNKAHKLWRLLPAAWAAMWQAAEGTVSSIVIVLKRLPMHITKTLSAPIIKITLRTGTISLHTESRDRLHISIGNIVVA